MRNRKVRGGVYFRSGNRGPAKFNGEKGWWWISYNVDGKQRRESTNALTKSEAIKIRHVKITDLERGELRLPGSRNIVLLHALADEYLAYAKLHKRSVRSDVLYVKRIKDHFDDVPVDRITRADCEGFKVALTREWQKRAWAKARGSRPEVRLTTVDRHVGCLKRLFNWAIDMDKMEMNPAARVKLYRQDAQTYYLLSEEEEERLLKAAEESKARHLRPIIILALATAMRKGEILGLKWDEVDLDKRMISLPGSSTKNKKVKHVPINADAKSVLLVQLEHKHETSPYVFPSRTGKKMHDFKTGWRCVKKKAGIPARCRFHDMKHTAVSRLVMRGVDPVTIGRMAGWTDSSAPVMLRRYTHLTGDHLHQAAKALERVGAKHKLSTSSAKTSLKKVARAGISN